MRKDRLFAWFPAAAAAALLVGCGGEQVTVQVVMDGPEGPVPQAKLLVDFYPFDRDSVFELLDTEATTPKPTIPADLSAAFDRSTTLQDEWRTKETAWTEVRERLKRLSEELAGLDRRSRAYRERYDEFNAMERQERRLDREKGQAFARFTSLQDSLTTRADSFRVVLESWEEETYAGYYDIESVLLEQTRRQVYQDTTNAQGYVTRPLPGGDWWVHSRVQIPRGEIVWNVLVNPADVDTLVLNRDNGEERVRL